VEVWAALIVLLAGLGSAMRGTSPEPALWRLHVVLAFDGAAFALAAILTALNPTLAVGTPLLLVVPLCLADVGLAIVQLRGRAGFQPPRWLL
jgi:hypothetical protein